MMLSTAVQQNRRILKSIMATIEVCGRQGLALRGHRYDAQHLSNPNINPGNFLAALQFRSQSDTVLADFFEKATKNVTYRSKTIFRIK